jgi:hypothetical protein
MTMTLLASLIAAGATGLQARVVAPETLQDLIRSSDVIIVGEVERGLFWGLTMGCGLLFEEHLVPSDVSGDALHLAVACVHEVDFLLTWNIRHLANPNKLDHLTVINRRLGLLTPQIVTPEMLWLE